MAHVLVVDDNPDVRSFMSLALKADGHDVLTVSCGEDALIEVERHDIDVMLLDIDMPGLNGFDTALLLREKVKDHWLPIVFVSGTEDESNFERCMEVGGDDYMTKPVTPIALRAKVRSMARLSDTQRQLARLVQELTRLSETDSLTRLHNRRTFMNRADQVWELSVRSSMPVSVLMIDVDGFKAYNDAYGHVAGDEALVTVAHTLGKSIHRSSDLVGRYGGEEFIILLPETELAQATAMAEELRLLVQQRNIPHKCSAVEGLDIVTVSIGIANCVPDPNERLMDLIDEADGFLYHAKNEGRNRAVSALNHSV